MYSRSITLAILAFVVCVAGVAPATQTHAQALSNACTRDSDCPPGLRCSMSNFNVSGNCVSLTPSGNTGQFGLSPGGNTGGTSLQPGGSDNNVTLLNPLNSGDCAPNQNCLLNFLKKILDFVIQIGTVAIILMLVYIGFLFVVAQGSDSKLTEAKNALLWTIIGALVLLGSKAISVGIEATVRALSVGQ